MMLPVGAPVRIDVVPPLVEFQSAKQLPVEPGVEHEPPLWLILPFSCPEIYKNEVFSVVEGVVQSARMLVLK